jgi:1,4-dihydroxy-6-naphthoate synthase
LGGIVIRRDVPQQVRERVERVLRRSIEYAFQNPLASREWVKAHAQEMEDDVIDKHIALFVNDFSLSLGEQGRKAISYLTGEVEL